MSNLEKVSECAHRHNNQELKDIVHREGVKFVQWEDVKTIGSKYSEGYGFQFKALFSSTTAHRHPHHPAIAKLMISGALETMLTSLGVSDPVEALKLVYMALDNTKTDLATEIHAFLKKIGLAYELERIRDNRVSFSGAGVPTEEELKAFLAENLQVLRPSSTESQASSGAEIQINPSTEISAVFNEVLEPMKETDKSALSEDDDFVIVDPNFVQEEAELPRSNEPIYMEEIEELEFPENTSVVAIPIRDEDRAKSAVAGVSSTAFYTSYEDFSKTHDRSGILAQVADRKAIQRKDAITKTLKLSETDAEKSGKYTFNL